MNRNGKFIKRSDSPTGFQKLLIAAKVLSKQFTLASLILKAWELYPESFSIPGTDQKYPSDKRVEYRLFGKKGLIKQDYMSYNKTTKFFSLTDLGWKWLNEIEGNVDFNYYLPHRNNPKHNSFDGYAFERMLGTIAWRLFLASMADAVSEEMAYRFWDDDPESTQAVLKRGLALVQEDGQTELKFLGLYLRVLADDVHDLYQLHCYLHKKYCSNSYEAHNDQGSIPVPTRKHSAPIEDRGEWVTGGQEVPRRDEESDQQGD